MNRYVSYSEYYLAIAFTDVQAFQRTDAPDNFSERSCCLHHENFLRPDWIKP